MSDAEATVKFAIFSAITSNWHEKSDPNFANIIRDSIFDRIFEPSLKWAIEEYLDEVKRLEIEFLRNMKIH